jgi:hypothetical protein
MKTRSRRAATAAALSLSALALAAGLASCAKVTVRKVPTPTQYTDDQWTKGNLQAKADAMEGVRFYLPRPFVSVFESFPIGTDIYIAHGTVSPDGEYVYINSITPLTTRVDITRPASAAEVVNFPPVPRGNIFRPLASTGGTSTPPRDIKPHSESEAKPDATKPPIDERIKKLEDLLAASEARAAAVDKAQNDAKKTLDEVRDIAAGASDKKDDESDTDGDSGSAPAQAAGATGRNSRTVTNSNGAFAYTPLRGNFDIVYLPDFDEQYVVSSQANLGNASFQMNMGQGWSLQGFNSISDNTELNKRIFALIDKASELASLAADAGMAALFPPAGLAAAASGVIKPQSEQAVELPPGTPVSLKIVVVHYAAKGLYPVIKPRELKGTPQSQLFVDLYATRDAQGRLLSFNAEAIDRAIDHYDQLQRRFSVPVYPYQYVSFNTFRYIAIEALTPAGSGYGDLYDKTGTAGDPGDRQVADLADILRDLLKQNGGLAPLTGGNPLPGQGGAGAGANADRVKTNTQTVTDFLNTPLNLGALNKALNAANESPSSAQVTITKVVPELTGSTPRKLVVKLIADKPHDAAKADAIKTALVKQMKELFASDTRTGTDKIVPVDMPIEITFEPAGT